MKETLQKYEKWSRRAYLGLLTGLSGAAVERFGNNTEWEAVEFTLEEDSQKIGELDEITITVLTEEKNEYSAVVEVYKGDEEFYEGKIRPDNPLLPGDSLDWRMRMERSPEKDYLHVERKKEQ